MATRNIAYFDSTDFDRLERADSVLATARLILAIAALAALYVGPSEHVQYRTLAVALLVLYTFFSTAVLALTAILNESFRLQAIAHVIDMASFTALTAVTGHANSAFFGPRRSARARTTSSVVVNEMSGDTIIVDPSVS